MTKLNPNKETIRRICYIFKCEKCWLLSEKNQASLLIHLETDKIDAFKLELESWSGYSFRIYNTDSPEEKQEVIIQTGEQLLPVQKDRPLADIEKRRKHMHKKAD
jgi:hypothetical protein